MHPSRHEQPCLEATLPPAGADLLEQIDTLAVELSATAEAAESGRVPIAARADFLRAQDAHRRALAAWAVASGEHQLDAVRDTLQQCRAALEASRARLRR